MFDILNGRLILEASSADSVRRALVNFQFLDVGGEKRIFGTEDQVDIRRLLGMFIKTSCDPRRFQQIASVPIVDQPIVVIASIKGPRLDKLFEVIDATDTIGFFFRLGQRRQQQRSENGNDRDDNE